MAKDKTCNWTRNHYRQYIIFDASMPAEEYLPGCIDACAADAWGSPPKFCPHCGGKVEVTKESRDCPHCGKTGEMKKDTRACPHCGGSWK